MLSPELGSRRDIKPVLPQRDSKLNGQPDVADNMRLENDGDALVPSQNVEPEVYYNMGSIIKVRVTVGLV